jgi:hypothetical protein
MSEDNELSCICGEKGCGHQMAWHTRVTTTESRCLVPGCFCYVINADPCDHVPTVDAEDDAAFLSQLGIVAD